MRGDVLAEVMARYPAVSFEATRVISGRTWQLQERFREVASLPVPARLARSLLRLAERHGEPVNGRGGGGIGGGTGAIALRLRLSRHDLAQITGTTLYTVSRVLSEWREEGLVDLGRERVVLTDPQGLAARAEPPAPADRPASRPSGTLLVTKDLRKESTMSKSLRTIVALGLLVAAFGMGFAAPEAVAVAPCDTYCTTDNCFSKCVCDTPEWGPKVTYCSQCPWVTNNPCAI